MTTQDVVNELRSYASPTIKQVLMKHGAQEPFLGVKVQDMKKVQKKIKTDYQLALDLYDTGIGDVMYFAGLIADDAKMTKKDLQRWADAAQVYPALSEYTVAWVASGSPHGREMALKWIESKKHHLATAGWATLSSLVATRPDDELDTVELKHLVQRVVNTIHDQPNRVRYVMNGFIIALGCHVQVLSSVALAAAKKIGKVHVDMNGTACKVPDAADYIGKVAKAGRLGVKRKAAKC